MVLLLIVTGLVGTGPAAAGTVATATTLEVGPDPAWVREPVVLTATVIPNPGAGTVRFSFCGGVLEAALNSSTGIASVTEECATPGTSTASASFLGTATHASSSGSRSVTLGQVATSVAMTVEPSPSYHGDSVILRATVTPNPGGGTVTFWDMTTSRCLCSVPVDPATGIADTEVPLFGEGLHDLDARFNAHQRYAGSSIGPPYVDHDVRRRETTTTLDIGEIGPTGDLDLTVSVSPVPDGGTFTIRAANGTVLVNAAPADVIDGTQAYRMHAPLPGTSPYTATYSGTTFYASSSSDPMPWTDERRPTTIALTASRTAGAPYDTWRFSMDVDDVPEGWLIDGVVRLYSGTQLLVEAAPSGNGIYVHDAVYTLPVSRTVYAEYSGSTRLGPSRSGDVAVTVTKIATTTTLELDRTTINEGESIQATVTVSPAPAVYPPNPVARLTFGSEAGDAHTLWVPIDPATGVGTATIGADDLVPEIWTARATFAETEPEGRRYVNSASAEIEVRSEPIGPRFTLDAQPVPAYVGEPMTITVTLDPVPSGGTIQLLGGDQWDRVTTVLGEEPIGGVAGASASFTVTATQGWQYRAVYSGTAADAPSRSRLFAPTTGQLPSTFLRGPAAWVFTPTSTFTWSAYVAPGPGEVVFECSIDSAAWFACNTPYTTPPLPDGLHTFRVRTTDGNGRVEPTPEVASWRIDTSPPVITAFVANAGKPVGTSSVPLAITVTDQTEGLHGGTWDLLLANSPTLDGEGRLANPSGWVTFSPTTTWDFTNPSTGGTDAEGFHTVYAQVADPFGHWSSVAQVTFRYDRTSPTLSVSVAGGVSWTSNPTPPVALCCLAADPSGIDRLLISNSPNVSSGVLSEARSVTPAASVAWSLIDPNYGGLGPLLPGSSRTITVHAQWRDRAGNWSAVATDQIVLRSSPFHPFRDVAAGSPFEMDIAWLYHAGITRGCGVDLFCPKEPLTRGEMAAFLSRALGLPSTTVDFFTDDSTSGFEADINRLAAAGITGGCGGGRYCPLAVLSREQMAAFLSRALDLPSASTDYFTDDEASPFEADINRLAAARITGGCAPGRFCPSGSLLREQMAAFLHRSLEP